MDRRLRRPGKARACLHQLGRCGFCGDMLGEWFSVDHLNRCRTDDAPSNLCACDGTCHDRKSFYERTPGHEAELQQMLEAASRNRGRWDSEIADMGERELAVAYAALPAWLRDRAPFAWLRSRRASLRNPVPPTLWGEFRYLSSGAKEPK